MAMPITNQNENLMHFFGALLSSNYWPSILVYIFEYLSFFMTQVYCWKGLRLSARQDLEGFSKFTEYGIEGVVPLELLPQDVRSKYQAKPNDRSKRSKKEEAKNNAHQVEENQVAATPATEMDGESIRTDTTPPPMEFDAVPIHGSQGGTSTSDELQKNSPDTDMDPEAGQLEADTEVEAGIIDENDADVDADVDADASG